MPSTRIFSGHRPRSFLWPRAEFWRLWGAALIFAALASGLVAGAARADEDPWSAQAFFRQMAAPNPAETLARVGQFAHHRVLAPALIGGQAAYRDARDAIAGTASDVVREAARFVGRGNPTGTGPRDWCADFVQFTLARSGHRTVRSRLARDAVRAGRPISHPVAGAIMSMPHHTGFVVRVVGPGRVLLLSGNHGHRVGYGIYSTRGARFAMPA